ncbi:MAG: cryptochrome/photolyase family protein [Balneolaceae bacterium]|nr:MAG: cryptochrome/photolyase family protein [Balneolaceae bacterium]
MGKKSHPPEHKNVQVLTGDDVFSWHKSGLSEDKNSHDLVYIHPDQLNLDVFPEKLVDRASALLFVESGADASRLPFHKKKLVLEWSAQRHFARKAAGSGWRVFEVRTGLSAPEYLRKMLEGNGRVTLHAMEPVSFDPRSDLEKLQKDYGDRVSLIVNRFFLADPEPWGEKVRSGYRMEYFYREMRRQTGYLMKNGKPEGGEWNYDDKNRKPLPKKEDVPAHSGFTPDEITREVIREVDRRFPDHFGETERFAMGVTREQALSVLDDFITHRLARFGPYQDAMAHDEPFLFHSLLSPYMNIGLLTAREVCEAVLDAYHASGTGRSTDRGTDRGTGRSTVQGTGQGTDRSIDRGTGRSTRTNGDNGIPLASVEGFIRQIIGWREYMRVYYEAMMPEVRAANFFSYDKPLPDLYWSAETGMRCMRASVESVRQHGYAHHIQRLMVLSNFSNLTATNPTELFEWFWYAFVDAHEWVVLPNVLGMSTFADGGVLASKPYVAGGNYIRKMSDYCGGCRYRVQDRTGKDACPFNYLYWAFVDREREHLKKNHRMGFMLKTWDKKSDDEKKEIRRLSTTFINSLEPYKGTQTKSTRKGTR